jgi:hypothetical protein
MNDPAPRPHFSVLGRIGIVFTVCVVALQVWSMGEFYLGSQRLLPRISAYTRACSLPLLSFPAYAFLYFIIMGRVSGQDVILSRWLYRVWAVSALSGVAFYFIGLGVR